MRVVQKYGGSSVADLERIRAVAKRVLQTRASGRELVVVVSAMGDTTDHLLRLAKQVAQNPPRRELDMLLSVGERISMALLTMAIRELGGDAISFTGSQCGIITDGHHFNARIVEVRPVRIEEELAKGRIVVVAGYQGVSGQKEITTLGRGGSDTTAVALAAALGAECEIYSDVDGVYSADPHMVDGARRLISISYEQMQELSLAGARVLNAQAVEFAKSKGILIHARGMDGFPGTSICNEGAHGVLAVAGDPDLLLLRAQLLEPLQLLAFLEECGICGRQLSYSCFSEAVLSLLISRETLPECDAFRSHLQERFGPAAQLLDGFGSVSIIGSGINDNFRIAIEGMRALPEKCQGLFTSPLRTTWIVSCANVSSCMAALHRALIASS